jgi:hypothetical protein
VLPSGVSPDRTGRSIADNAAPHAGKRVILKLDFRDFSNSITPDDLAAVLNDAVPRAPYPRLTFNDDKRGIFTGAGRRLVTGLVLTPNGKVSLGRERKRTISAALHHITVGRNATRTHREETRGWLAYANSVEPTFVMTVAVQYPRAFRTVMGMGFTTREVLSEAALE